MANFCEWPVRARVTHQRAIVVAISQIPIPECRRPPSPIPPLASVVFLVMILMTSFTAFAPHTIAPDPRITSMRSMSSSGVLGIPANASKERRVAEALAITKDDMPKLKEELEKAISKVPNFDKIKDQIEMTISPEGLRIELLESETGTFFRIGNSAPSDNGKALRSLLA